MYTDPGNSINTKAEDELGYENHRMSLMQQPAQVHRFVKVKIKLEIESAKPLYPSAKIL